MTSIGAHRRSGAAVALALTAVLALTSCSSKPTSATNAGATPSASVAETPSAAVPSSAAPASTSATPPKAKQLTAETIAKSLARDLHLKVTAVYTAATDPNGKLGKPGQYTGKAAWTDPRVHQSKVVDGSKGSVDLGGSVEIFPDTAQASARASYIQAILKAAGGALGSERDYVSGGVLVRVSGALAAADAKSYVAAIQKITGASAASVTV